MNHSRTGGPAAYAGPSRFSRRRLGAALPDRARRLLAAAAVIAACGFGGVVPGAGAVEWIPPRPVSVWLGGATIAPGRTVAMELVIRVNGPAASLAWDVAATGNFVAVVSPASGAQVIGPNALVRVPITVGVPSAALGIGALTATVTYANGGTLAAKTSANIIAATNGRPEIWPATPTWSGAGGSSGNVSFQIRSGIGSAETIVLTPGRSNPDPNNFGALFSGTSPPGSVSLPGGATIGVNAPTTLAARAPAGSSNVVQVSVTSTEGISTATAFGIVDASLPDSLPTALVPSGLVPLAEASAGRDGPAPFLGRNAWLIPCGSEGVKVWRASAADSIGLTDLNGDGIDDRLVGTIRIPAFAAALSIVPGFVAASGETLDVGLLAAGAAGLMVLDLRTIEDPPFGAWEDFFDSDQNGIDDRILRTIPLAGFATDVAWTRSPSGRVIAFVAGADAGSNPVLQSFDPFFTSPGSGAGVVAVDIVAAVDSLSGTPPVVGAWPTPGNALDVELRGGGAAATLAVADGDAGLSVADVTMGAGAPAAVSFAPRGGTPLSASWGAPYARDVAWLGSGRDSAYVAIGAGPGGLQLARVPRALGVAPTLVLAQQTGGAVCGVAAAYTGMLASAQGTAGVALFQAPNPGALDLVTSVASAPYTAPVALARGVAFPGVGGAALEKASFQNPAGGPTALAFEPTLGPLPDLFVSDSARVVVLRPGTAAVTAVAEGHETAPPARGRVRLTASPNPSSGDCLIRAVGFAPTTDTRMVGGVSGGATSGASGGALGATLHPGDRVDILDVQGRLVRTLDAGPAASGGAAWSLAWDGRDRVGRLVPSGRYWVRLRDNAGRTGEATPILILR